MNKRSLIFVILLTCVLFFINQWFGTKEQERKTKTTVSKTTGETFPPSELSKEVVPISSLPIVALYATPNGGTVETLALKIDQQYLTLSWTKDLPNELYDITLSEPQKLILRIDTHQLGDPVLYSANAMFSLHAAYLPANEIAGLQVLYFSERNTKPNVTFAEYNGKDIFFPTKEPSKPGIVLYKVENEYLPAGIYNPSTLKFYPMQTYPGFASIVTAEHFVIPSQTTTQAEQFYVLENEYQQLVFSNIGGAITEINLPFHSKEHPQSVVQKIGFDRTMQKDYSDNDYYPSQGPYQIVDDSGNIQTIPAGVLGEYYPLLRRNIIGPGRHIRFQVPPHYHACNVVTEDPETNTLLYKVKRFEKNLIEFEGIQTNRKITKTFSFPKDYKNAPYCFNMSVRVEGDSRNLFLTSGVPEVELISGSWTPSIKYRTSHKNKIQVEQVDLPKTSTSYNTIVPDWVSNSNGYFGIILDPLTSHGQGFSVFHIPGDIAPSRITVIDSQHDLYPLQKYPGYGVHLPLHLKNQVEHFRIFAGPFEDTILKTIDTHYSNPAVGYNPDYVMTQSFHGWFAFISEPFAKFLFILMKFFHQITTSWGISIILLTIALRIMLYPLNAWSIKSSTRMQEIAPQVSAIQQKYKKDPKKAQMEIMSLYKEKGVNPLTGCLPLLIQMPFLIGMFDLLKSTFDLRGASFIPGWIDNLTAPDVLFSWNYPIIFFGTDFHLLPIILGVVMFLQQRYSSTAPKDPQLMTDQQRQQRAMGNILAIVFTVMFYHFPSGLNIYWLSSMLLGILQQWYMTRKKKPLLTVVKGKK